MNPAEGVPLAGHGDLGIGDRDDPEPGERIVQWHLDLGAALRSAIRGVLREAAGGADAGQRGGSGADVPPHAVA